MKKIFFCLTLLLAGTFLYAQNEHQRRDNNIPEPVQQNFKKDHPEVNNSHWSKSNGKYHASYTHDNRKTDSYYDAKGTPLYTRTPWTKKELPSDFDRKIRSRYHTSKYQVAKIDRPNNQSLFELILNISGKNKTVYTDENGEPVRFTK